MTEPSSFISLWLFQLQKLTIQNQTNKIRAWDNFPDPYFAFQTDIDKRRSTPLDKQSQTAIFRLATVMLID